MLLGFAGALRRGELSALERSDVRECDEGLWLRVGRSKTDPEAHGAHVAIPYGGELRTCPVRALRTWSERLGPGEGALFRAIDRHGRIGTGPLTGRGIAHLLKRAAERAGLEPERYSGHSLRAGLATAAARAGKDDRSILRQGRWSSRATLDGYVRDRDAWRDNAASGLGL